MNRTAKIVTIVACTPIALLVGIGAIGAVVSPGHGSPAPATSSPASHHCSSGAVWATRTPGGAGCYLPATHAATTPAAAAAVKPSPTAIPVTVVRTVEAVEFNVWGSAPDSVSVTYGSDSVNDSPQGGLGPLGDGSAVPFSATLPYSASALYYYVSAQLQGSGAISCDVDAMVTTFYSNGTHATRKSTVATGSASGGYNICDAQSS